MTVSLSYFPALSEQLNTDITWTSIKACCWTSMRYWSYLVCVQELTCAWLQSLLILIALGFPCVWSVLTVNMIHTRELKALHKTVLKEHINPSLFARDKLEKKTIWHNGHKTALHISLARTHTHQRTLCRHNADTRLNHLGREHLRRSVTFLCNK